VSAPVDRELVTRLLQDGSLSFREIARRANCSDWSVRSIARQLGGVSRSDDVQGEPMSATGCAVFAGIVLLIGVLWFAGWRLPPSDGGAM
jgi:hypothetical protein